MPAVGHTSKQESPTYNESAFCFSQEPSLAGENARPRGKPMIKGVSEVLPSIMGRSTKRISTVEEEKTLERERQSLQHRQGFCPLYLPRPPCGV